MANGYNLASESGTNVLDVYTRNDSTRRSLTDIITLFLRCSCCHVEVRKYRGVRRMESVDV